MNCNICGRISTKIFQRTILNKYHIDYFQCSSCGFIQTEEPYWLDDAYHDSLNIEDTGIVSRNILFAKRTSAIIFFYFKKNGSFTDLGGGTGLFVRLMRDYGFDFFWEDPFTKNVYARGFEYDKNNQSNIELVTSFECFEHFVDPLKEIEKMLSISPSILLSTVPFIDGTPDPETWEYYSFGSGQHISLYSLSSLAFIAKKYNLNFYTNKKSFHLMTNKTLNNNVFNWLLKASYITMPGLIKPWMKNKNKSDINIVKR